MRKETNSQILLAALAAALFVTNAFAAVEAVPGEFVVKMRRGDFHSLSGAGFTGGEALTKDIFLVRSPEELGSLQHNPAIERVEPNYIYRKLGAVDWGLENTGQTDCGGESGPAGIDVRARDAWKITEGDPSVVVAVIDTGVDITLPRLQNQLLVNEEEAKGRSGVDDDGNGYVDDTYGFDFTTDSGLWGDENGHGTFCAGLIAAAEDPADGVAGLAPKSKILPVRFLDANGRGTLANAIKAIDYALARGARVLSNSWGGGTHSELLELAVNRAESKGALFVAAAGNNSSDTNLYPYYPASYRNVLSVAVAGRDGGLASFSNYGARVQIAAPGTNLTGLRLGGGTTCSSGTSMAVPLVAATAALVWARDSKLTAETVKARIVQSVTKLPALDGKVTSGGILNALGALLAE